MFIRGIFPGILLIVFALFALASKGAAQHDRVVYTSEEYFKTDTPLQCYDCSSEYDPRCGDPFNPYSIGIINCSEQVPPEHLVNPELTPSQRLKPTVCRKIVQKVQGKKRVIRECGYIQDERDDKTCVRRTGTKDVEVFYCACTKSLCNDGSLVRPFFLLLGLIFIISLHRLM